MTVCKWSGTRSSGEAWYAVGAWADAHLAAWLNADKPLAWVLTRAVGGRSERP